MAKLGTGYAMTERWTQHDTHSGERWFTYNGRGRSNGHKVRDGDVLRVHGRYGTGAHTEQVQEGTAEISHCELQHRDGLVLLIAWDIAGGQYMVRQAPTDDDPRPVLIPAPRRQPTVSDIIAELAKPPAEPVPWTKDGCVICGYVGRSRVERQPYGPVCSGVCKARARRLVQFGAENGSQP